MGPAVADGEAVHAVVSLRPPAVQNGEVEATVQYHLLPAGAGGFERPARIVEPDVHALHEQAPYVDVVVFYKDEFVGELRIAHQFRDLLQHALPRLISRMRLSGEHKLDGTIGIVDH